MKKWKCTVCGYIYTGEEPPEKCPVCGADKSKFVEETEEQKPEEKASSADPAESGQAAGEDEAGPGAGADDGEPPPEGKARDFGATIVRYHAHPIAVHIPNGALPMTFVFALLALLFGSPALEVAAICNMAFILLAMPAVLYTGYVSWQHKYNGARTDVFLTKIVCGALVTVLALLLLCWWVIDPAVARNGGAPGWIFLLLNLLTLGFAIIAGLMGGKLVFKD